MVRPIPRLRSCLARSTVDSKWQSTFSRIRAVRVRRGRSVVDVEGLVQEAWVRLAGYERDAVVEQPEAFVMRTALNLSIDQYRSGLSHGEELALEEEVLVDPMPGIEATVLARKRMERLGK